MMSLLTDRDEFGVGSALLGVATAILATATATSWGVPVSSTLIVLMALRGRWQAMPNWLMLLWAGVPVVTTEASDVGNSGFFVVVVALLIAAANGLSRVDKILAAAAVAMPTVLWAARVEDYVEFGPWTWSAGLLIGLLFGAVIGRQWELIDELHATQEQLAVAAVDDERQRIAREMHDVVGHSFSVVLLHLAGARTMLESPEQGGEESLPRAVDALHRAETVGRRGMEDLRQTIGLMRTGSGVERSVPDVGEITQLVDEYRAAGLDVDAELDDSLDDVTGAARLVAHDVVRESLTNCAKYAAEGRVGVVVSVSDECIDVRVENPIGPSIRASAGTGIALMRQRVEALGGTLTAAAADRSWVVRAQIPRELDRPVQDSVLGGVVTR